MSTRELPGYCSFTKAIEHLGDRWSLLIVRQLGVFGPLGFNELARSLPGRISRSVLIERLRRLETLGLVERREGAADKRVREAVVTPQGQALIDSIDEARERMATAILAEWNEEELDDLTRLMRRLADALLEG